MSIKNNMNHYQIFLYAAKSQSMTTAAKELFITQSSVTRAIKQLETQLGCTLFIRSAKGLSLTPEGEILYEAIEPALARIEAAESKIDRINKLQAGTIKIAINNLAAEWIIEVIQQSFSRKYPGISVIVSTVDDRDLFHLLKNGYVDIAFRYERSENHLFSDEEVKKEHLEKTSYGTYEDIFIVGSCYKKLADSPVTLHDICNLPLIAPITMDYNAKYYLSALRPDGFTDNDFPVDGLRHRLKLVEMNKGFCYIPKHFITSLLKQGIVFSLTVEQFPMRSSSLYTLHHLEHPLSEATRTFFKFLLHDIF